MFASKVSNVFLESLRIKWLDLTCKLTCVVQHCVWRGNSILQFSHSEYAWSDIWCRKDKNPPDYFSNLKGYNFKQQIFYSKVTSFCFFFSFSLSSLFLFKASVTDDAWLEIGILHPHSADHVMKRKVQETDIFHRHVLSLWLPIVSAPERNRHSVSLTPVEQENCH